MTAGKGQQGQENWGTRVLRQVARTGQASWRGQLEQDNGGRTDRVGKIQQDD
jgi:hypothetical protein